MTMPSKKTTPWLGTVHLLSTFSKPIGNSPFRKRRQSINADKKGDASDTINKAVETSAAHSAKVAGRVAKTDKTSKSARLASARTEHRFGVRGSTIVRVVERPTSTTASVYWSDPSHCHYGHQPWRAGAASIDGYCALSGHPIHRGDLVFRPSKLGLGPDLLPVNASAMILSASMPEPEDAGVAAVHS